VSLNEGGGHNVFAIVETGGKQYKIQEGDLIKVEKINAEIGAVTVLDKVLAVGQDNGQVLIGTPVVSGAKVTAKVIDHDKAKKIIVFKYKPKKNYRRKQGHRQPFTKLLIEKIEM